ncbi:MAG TPA: AraC family transcriptional regulator, partial [Daejeonella sp.]
MDVVSKKHLLKARLFIERNLNDHLDGDIISEQAFRSYYRFHHKFKESTGESLWQYVKRLRLEKACFLLRYTSIPISEIAFLTGFETTAALSKAFSSRIGRSPIKYRNEFLAMSQKYQAPDYNWNDVKTTRQPDQKIYTFRSEGLRRFPEGYFKWQTLVGSIPENNVPLIGRSPDQVGITDTEKLRWDTSIPQSIMTEHLKSELPEQPLLFEDTLPGGRFLKVPFRGFGRP